MRNLARKVAEKKNKVDAGVIKRVKNLGDGIHANKLAKQNRIKTKAVENLKKISREEKEKTLIAMLRKDIPVMTSTPEVINKHCKETMGPVIYTPDDFYSNNRIGKSRVNSVNSLTCTPMSSLTRRGIQTRKIFVKDVGSNNVSVSRVMHSLEEQQNCFAALVKQTQQKELEKKSKNEKRKASESVKINREIDNDPIDLDGISMIESENKKESKKIVMDCETFQSDSFKNLRNIESVSKDSFNNQHGDILTNKIPLNKNSFSEKNNETVRKDMKSLITGCNESTKYEDCFQSFQNSQRNNIGTDLTGVGKYIKDQSRNKISISSLYISKNPNKEKSTLYSGKNLSVINKSTKGEVEEFISFKKNESDKENWKETRSDLVRKSSRFISYGCKENTSITKEIISSKKNNQKSDYIYKETSTNQEDIPIVIINDNDCANDSLDNQIDYEEMKTDKKLSVESCEFEIVNKTNYSANSNSSSSKRTPLAELSVEDLEERSGNPPVTSKCIKYCSKKARNIVKENMYYSTETERFLIKCLMNFYCTCHDDAILKFAAMEKKYQSFELSYLKLACRIISSECMDGDIANKFIKEILSILPCAEDYSIYWLIKAIIAEKMKMDPIYYFKESLRHVKQISKFK